MIGERLKQLRQERGISQEDLAKIIGVRNTSVSMYETNRSSPNERIMSVIVQYFNVSADYFMGIIDEAVPPYSKDAFIPMPSGLPEAERVLLHDFVEFVLYRAKKQGGERDYEMD